MRRGLWKVREVVTRGGSILAPERGVPILLVIPHVGRGKRRGKTPFSLISRGHRTACAPRPPPSDTRSAQRASPAPVQHCPKSDN